MTLTRRDLGLTAAAAALAACSPKPPPAPKALDGLLDDFARQLLADSPELATAAGLGADLAGPGFDAKLDDRSALTVDLRRSAVLRRLAQLDGLAPQAIPPEQAENFAVVRRQTALAANGAKFAFGQFSALGGPAPYVLNPLDCAALTLPDFFQSRCKVANIAGAEAYVARLDGVGKAIDSETARARADAVAGITPPLVLIDKTMTALAAFMAMAAAATPYALGLSQQLTTAFPATAPDTAPPARAAQLQAQAERIIATAIAPAYRRQYDLLASLRARAAPNSGVWTQPKGAEFYAACLAWHTTTDMPANAIHDLGLKRVADVTAQLDIQLRALGVMQGTVGERMATLSVDPRFQYEQSDAGKAQALADLRALLQRVQTRTAPMFVRQPKAALAIEATPAFAEANQPGAYYQPPTLDGSRAGIFTVNLRDMREWPKFDLATLVAHEGVPGHHFQIALAQETNTLPLLRRLMSFTAYAEGWALYAEQLADEVGVYEGEPWSRLGYLRWRLWRAARLVVDTGLHALQWTREQAIQYLRAATGDALSTIETEVDRYLAWPGQACAYEIGHGQIAAMREAARRRLGAAFDIKGFHSAVLDGGDMPLDVLTKRVAGWTPK